MTDYQREESETDRLADEWHERQPGLTQAEIMDAIKRVSDDVEKLYKELERQGHVSVARGADVTLYAHIDCSGDDVCRLVNHHIKQALAVSM